MARSEVRYRATVSFAIASEAVRALAQAPAGRRALIYVSNGYHGDEPLRDQVPELTRLAKETGVTIFAVDPRGLSGAIVAEPSVDLAAWKNHLTTTRESLRVLSEPTGGFVVFEAADLADALRRIDTAMRK